MTLPGTEIGSGATVRAVIWTESELGPQSFHEKPRRAVF